MFRSSHKESKTDFSSKPQILKRFRYLGEKFRRSVILASTTLFSTACIASCTTQEPNVERSQKHTPRFLYNAHEAMDAIAKAEAAFVSSQPTRRTGNGISVVQYYGTGWEFQVTPATGSSLAEIQAAFEFLRSTPCTLPGFSNWLEYILGSVKEVRLQKPNSTREEKGRAEIEVMYAVPKDGKYYFKNLLGDGVVKITEGNSCMPATLVHEATHLYPIPAVIPSLPGLSKEQLAELFPFSMEMRFIKDQKDVPSVHSKCLYEDLERSIVSMQVPRVLEGSYTVTVSSK